MTCNSAASGFASLPCVIARFLGLECWSSCAIALPLLLRSLRSFERLHQCLADFVDIARSQSQHDVTSIECSDELLGDLAFVRNKFHVHVSSSLDPLIQRFAGHA